MQFTIQQLSTQVLKPTTESKRAVRQLIRYQTSTQHTCLRLEPREMVQTSLLELVGRSDSDWASDSATRQSVTGYHCDVQSVSMCNRSLKQTAISVSVLMKQRSTQPVLAAENCWDSPNSSRNFITKFQFVSKWIQTRQDTFCSAKDQVDSNTSTCDACQYSSGYERRLSVSRADTKNNTADLLTKHLDVFRTIALAKKLGPRFLDMADGGTNGNDR